MADETLKREFIANPVSVLAKKGVLTVEDTKIAGIDDCYNILAKKLEEGHPSTQTNAAGTVVLAGVSCWPCKIAAGVKDYRQPHTEPTAP